MAFYHKSRVTALSLRHSPAEEQQSSFHGLPPRKRFKLLHAQLQHRLPSPLDKKRILAPFFPPAAFENSLDFDESEEESLVKCSVPVVSSDESSVDFKNSLDQGKREVACLIKRDVNPVVDSEKTSIDAGRGGDDDGNNGEDDGDDGIICDVCRGTDADPSDPIVLCDGCDVGVHVTCYGSPLLEGIPDGEWKCRRCAGNGEGEKCFLCPVRDGAMKMTTTGGWAHVFCALFVAEVFFQHASKREGVECRNVPRWRFEVACCVCGENDGACLQCTEAGCDATFHVSCAIQCDLVLEYWAAPITASSSNSRRRHQRDIVISFCPLHTPSWNSEHRHCKIVPRDS